MRSLRLLGASSLALTAIGAGTAAAAPGGGAVSAPTTCLISAPGFPDTTGTGRVLITPSGNQHLTCQGQLPAGSAPSKSLRLDAGPCTILITTSGAITARC